MAKSAFITGAASGIGKAVARRLLAQGWRVGLADLNTALLTTTATELGGDHAIVTLDVTDAGAVQAALAAFCPDGRLDVLVNNAGILSVGQFADIPLARHDLIIDINVKGVLHCAHAAYAYLKAARGQLINLSSASAIFGTPHFASYSASKFAVRGLTEALAVEWAPDGIRVCDVMPPFVNTPMLAAEQAHSPVVARLGVDLSPEQVAEEIVRVIGAGRRRIHNPITRSFTALRQVAKLIPDRATAGIMGWLARP